MVITHSQLVTKRREKVFELYYRGYSCRQIAIALGNVSFKTVANDINWWERQAEQEIAQHKSKLALAHKKAKANFEYLLIKAHEQFEKADKEGDEDRKIDLYPIIESLVADLQAVETAGDILDREQQERAEDISEDLERHQNNNAQVSERSN